MYTITNFSLCLFVEKENKKKEEKTSIPLSSSTYLWNWKQTILCRFFFVSLPTYSLAECSFPEQHVSKTKTEKKTIFSRFYCDLKSITTVVSHIPQIGDASAHLPHDTHDFLSWQRRIQQPLMRPTCAGISPSCGICDTTCIRLGMYRTRTSVRSSDQTVRVRVRVRVRFTEFGFGFGYFSTSLKFL